MPPDGIRLARSPVVLELDPLAPRPPRLPHRRSGPLRQLAASIALHISAVLIATVLGIALSQGTAAQPIETLIEEQPQVVHLVFLPSATPLAGAGGGGGGNQQDQPLRRAHGVGSDRMTVRLRNQPAPSARLAAMAVEDVAPVPSILLDGRPLASGLFDQSGLPAGAVMSGTSTGPGFGGGVGTGSGTGVGPGVGPGLGPGSGGGTGGGVYHAGGAVAAPRVITAVRPRYTSAALLNKIQGAVTLEVVVTSDGRTSHIRIVRSLDPGLDEEAVAAAAGWRFEPGRLGNEPVDVLVTIVLTFALR